MHLKSPIGLFFFQTFWLLMQFLRFAFEINLSPIFFLLYLICTIIIRRTWIFITKCERLHSLIWSKIIVRYPDIMNIKGSFPIISICWSWSGCDIRIKSLSSSWGKEALTNGYTWGTNALSILTEVQLLPKLKLLF